MVELDDLRCVAGIAPAVPTLDLPYYIDRNAPDLKSLRKSLEVSHLASCIVTLNLTSTCEQGSCYIY